MRRWVERIKRGKGILTTILDGMVKGKRKTGRKRLKIIDDIKN